MKKKVENYKQFCDKEVDGLVKPRKAANRLKRTHDSTRQHNRELGKLLSELYKKRKHAVQHAIQNKISADRLKRTLIIDASPQKITVKVFWEMLGEDKSRRNPSLFIDPVDKTTLIENKGKIEKCFAKHFSDIGKDNLASQRHQAKVKTFLDNIKNNKVPTQNMKRPSIEKILK